jgi:glycosyltransferase involved in cell wall biosynthesis
MTGAGPTGQRLHVTVLHNYRDDQQPSMRLYAEHLGQALLRRNVAVSRIRPPTLVPDEWRARSAGWAKVDGYLGRFVIYPRLVRSLTTDIIHIADHGQGYLVPGLDGRRTVVTCHDLILLALAAGRIGSTRIPPLALHLFRIAVELMKGAAAIVADSMQTKRDLTDFIAVDPAKVSVIHPGLNQPFAPDPNRALLFRREFSLGDRLLMLQIGRTFYKNITGTLRVLHKLRSDGVDVELVRAGRPLFGPERALAERLNIISHVVELGPISDSRLPALYNAVDLLLFPSHYEGFGWPPLEAMASGTPVVCSRAGSLAEIVGDAALTADPEDIDTLAWHAGALLTNNSLRTTLTARGLTQAARFSWDRAAEQMIELYRGVLARA